MNDFQFKENRYSYGSTYLNSMVSTNRKYTIHSQKTKRKELKHTTKENHQTTKGKTTTRRTTKENYKNNRKTRIKIAISTYLSIITLNVNGLNAPTKR